MTGIIILVIQANGDSLPAWVIPLYDFPNGDKAGHFLLMGTAALLINLVSADKSFRFLKLSIPIVPLIFAGLVAIEEFSQQFFPNRTASWEDLVVSYLGILLIGVIGSRFLIRQYRNKKKRTL